MILPALNFTQLILNEFLKNTYGLDESAVVLNNIVNEDGGIPEKNINKVIVSLTHIEQEALKPFYNQKVKLDNGNYAKPPEKQLLNLELIVISNFYDYRESLRFLDASMRFFQMNPVFEAANFPAMPETLEKLNFELLDSDYQKTQSVWSALGAKYKPSVMYKIRIINSIE